MRENVQNAEKELRELYGACWYLGGAYKKETINTSDFLADAIQNTSFLLDVGRPIGVKPTVYLYTLWSIYLRG